MTLRRLAWGPNSSSGKSVPLWPKPSGALPSPSSAALLHSSRLVSPSGEVTSCWLGSNLWGDEALGRWLIFRMLGHKAEEPTWQGWGVWSRSKPVNSPVWSTDRDEDMESGSHTGARLQGNGPDGRGRAGASSGCALGSLLEFLNFMFLFQWEADSILTEA